MQYQIQPTILIADANEQNRKILCAQLSEEYTILEAEHGLQALQFLDKQSIGAVLYDYALPGLNAKEFLTLRQNNPSLEKVPVGVVADQKNAGHIIEPNPHIPSRQTL